MTNDFSDTVMVLLVVKLNLYFTVLYEEKSFIPRKKKNEFQNQYTIEVAFFLVIGLTLFCSIGFIGREQHN